MPSSTNQHLSYYDEDTLTISSIEDVTSFKEELDNYLAQLKYKKTFENDDNYTNGKCARVLRNRHISKVMIKLCGGKGKRGLSKMTRELLWEYRDFFVEYIIACRFSGGSKVKHILMELVHCPEFIIFQRTLGNDPIHWCQGIVPVMKDNKKMEILAEELKEEVHYIRKKRLGQVRDNSIMRKKLDERIAFRNDLIKSMDPVNVKVLQVTRDECKSEIEKIIEKRSKLGKIFVTNEDVTDLVSRFEKLRGRHDALKKELEEFSTNGVLPPDINKASGVLMERKVYLESLMAFITNSANNINFSANDSFNDSLYMK